MTVRRGRVCGDASRREEVLRGDDDDDDDDDDGGRGDRLARDVAP